MKQDVKEYVIQKLNEMTSIPYCCAEAKAAAAHWMNALGTDKEAEQTAKLFAELEDDLLPIDGLVAFAGSEAGVKVFGGEEGAQKEIFRAKERKAAGAKYCDCPACAAALAILDKREELIPT